MKTDLKQAKQSLSRTSGFMSRVSLDALAKAFDETLGIMTLDVPLPDSPVEGPQTLRQLCEGIAHEMEAAKINLESANHRIAALNSILEKI
jgi:hypothetical protein